MPPSPDSPYWWILRDLSNGDGAEGRLWPTYIWAYATRREARDRASRHRGHSDFARLGPVEYRDAEEIARRYRFGTGPSEHYGKGGRRRMKTLHVVFHSAGIKKLTNKEGQIVLPKADLIIDARSSPEPACEGDLLNIGEARLDAYNAAYMLVKTALRLLHKRRPGRELEDFHVLCLCAWGMNRSVALKKALADTFDEACIQVIDWELIDITTEVAE